MALVQLARPNNEAPADSGMMVPLRPPRAAHPVGLYLSARARPLIVIADDLNDDTAAREAIRLVLERRVGPILCLAT